MSDIDRYFDAYRALLFLRVDGGRNDISRHDETAVKRLWVRRFALFIRFVHNKVNGDRGWTVHHMRRVKVGKVIVIGVKARGRGGRPFVYF